MLATAIKAVMVDLLTSNAFRQSDWRLFHTLACRLQPQPMDLNPHQPAPLITALGFDSVVEFVTAPTKKGGLAMPVEKWNAVMLAVAAVEQAPWMANVGYSLNSLSTLQSFSVSSGHELPTSMEGMQEFLAAISPTELLPTPFG
jgi:hypothetical protein